MGGDTFFLTSGRLRAPGFAFAQRPLKSLLGGLSLTNTVAVHLRDNGDVVLVDTGFSEAIFAEPRKTLGIAQARVLGVTKGDYSIARQLEHLGIPRSRVTTVVATHLHRDHISGVVDFPNAELVCSARELESFRSRRSAAYEPRDLERSGRLRPVSLSGSPSYGFPCSLDLMKDGSVVLLDAPGHTSGSVAVALRGQSGTFVHVGDAVYRSWEYARTQSAPSLLAQMTAHDRKALSRTYCFIRACEADPRRPIIVPSHDELVFARLPQSPLLPVSEETMAPQSA